MSPDKQRVAIAEACGWKKPSLEKRAPVLRWGKKRSTGLIQWLKTIGSWEGEQ